MKWLREITWPGRSRCLPGLLLIAATSTALAASSLSTAPSSPLSSSLAAPCGPGAGGATDCDGAGPASPGSSTGVQIGAGNPINLLSGNKYQQETDLAALPGTLGLEIVRHYNSSQRGLGLIGRSWRLSYETRLYARGNTLQIATADGRLLIFQRDPKQPSLCASLDPANGRLTTRRDHLGREVYDWHWPNGRKLSFNHSGLLLTIGEPDGQMLMLTYGARDELVQVIDPQGRRLNLIYATKRSPGFKGIVAIDSPIGRFEYAHESSGAGISNLLKVTAPDGSIRHYHYEDPAHPQALTGISQAVPAGDGQIASRRLNTWAYDARGRAVLSVKGAIDSRQERIEISYPTSSLPDGSPGETVLTNSQGRQSRYRHAQIGGQHRLQEARGPGCASCGEMDVRYDYDRRGSLIGKTKLNDYGQPQWQVRWQHDDRGRITRTTRQDWSNGQPGAQRLLERREYHGVASWPILIARPSVVAGHEHRLEIEYNTHGQPLRLRETGYSPLTADGQLIANPGQARPLERITTYTYQDIRGRSRLIQIDGPLPNGPKASPEDSDITRYEWDDRGRFIVGIEAPGGFVSHYEHDAAGRVTARRFDDGYRRIDTTLAYATQTAAALQPERIERNAWLRDTPARRIEQVLLQSRFDAQGRRIYQQGADGNLQTLSYDAAGRPVSLRNVTGEQLHWAYDADSRLLAQITQDAQGQTLDGRLWLRDESGRLRATLTPDGIERIHAYLDEGLSRVPVMKPVNRSAATPATSVSPKVLHDDFGRAVWQSHPEDGELVTLYEGEPGHQRQMQIQRALAPEARPIEETLIFDPAGRLVERRRNGCAERLHYEGKLLMRLAGCGSTQRYERDALGLITAHHQQHEAVGQPLILSERFHYDAASRLRTRTLADGQVLSYGYDRAGRTAAVRLQRTWRRLLAGLAGEEMADTLTHWLPESWRYRSAIERIRHRPFETGITALAGLSHGNGESQHWARPRPATSAAAPSAPPQLQPEGDAHRDAYGRQTRHVPASGPNQGKALRLIWDDAHQLIEVRNAQSDAPIARYVYDSLGNRIAKTVFDGQGQGHTSRYLYDTAHRLIAQTSDSGRIERHYLYADHRAHSLLTGQGELFAVTTDWRGLPNGVSNARRQTVWTGKFDAWGFAKTSGDDTMPLRLAGQQWDAESGLSYNIHRYYDPARGRYLSPDPLGTRDGSDRYAYLNGNPNAGIDPLGLFKIPLSYFGAGYLSGMQHNVTLGSVSIGDAGHGDILRIAFHLYNQQHGQRFSQTIIDQIILHNYHTDAMGWNGGQLNKPNHFDNPNTGPHQLIDPKTNQVIDGNRYEIDWFQRHIDEINAWRGLYGTTNGLDISSALNAFGRNSHTLADFYAHTNWVDAPYRGGCHGINWMRNGRMEKLEAWVPPGLDQYMLWDETARSGLFSGTVCVICGDIGSNTDLKHTHAYWAKDDEHHIGGADTLDFEKLSGLPVEFQNRYEVRPDGRGGYSVVTVAINNKYDLAFHLAVMHTLQEIEILWDKAEDIKLSSGVKLTDVFGFSMTDLDFAKIKYQAFFSKSGPPSVLENKP